MWCEIMQTDVVRCFNLLWNSSACSSFIYTLAAMLPSPHSTADPTPVSMLNNMFNKCTSRHLPIHNGG